MCMHIYIRTYFPIRVTSVAWLMWPKLSETYGAMNIREMQKCIAGLTTEIAGNEFDVFDNHLMSLCQVAGQVRFHLNCPVIKKGP